jgi:DNA-binding beta-propeller fold protein YncE
MNCFARKSRVRLHLLVLGCACACAAQTPKEITLPGSRLYTESITSLRDGTLIVGSLGKGTVSRIPYKTDTVTEWIPAGTNGMHDVFGVFADEKFKTLWVCSDKTDAGVGEAALKAFDLKTATPKGSYLLPGEKAFCNDIAVAGDGTAYVTDTEQATLLMLKPGAKELVVAAKDPLLAGADGLAFGEKRVLYVNSVTTNKLLRVKLNAEGRSESIADLKLSKPLTAPDGMRTLGRNRLLLAENSGNMDIVTFDGAEGQNAEIDTIKSGLESTPAVTATRGVAWVAEGKLNYRDEPALKDKNPDPFKLYAVKLPKY